MRELRGIFNRLHSLEIKPSGTLTDFGRGLDFVKLELYLVSIGHNLYKFYNKSLRSQTEA